MEIYPKIAITNLKVFSKDLNDIMGFKGIKFKLLTGPGELNCPDEDEQTLSGDK